ncbi:MAG TPA: 5-(carboxyamino)imidazole ribonucleotide synthase [Ignavibacteriaceae bacterium]|nr:5-(carboxyamino)imidazole ribonucleotide synthase [Ignavibacteriaceae bacterium]
MREHYKIGILGGGQLARMSTFAAKRLGFDTIILEKEKKSPAGQITNKEFVGWVNDLNLLKEFAKASDIITLENEFVDADRLKFVEELGIKVVPSPKTIRLIQDKLTQKKTLEKKGIPVPKFLNLTNKLTFSQVQEKLSSSKFIIKSRKMGYDGYGNALVHTENEFLKSKEKLVDRHSELMAEEFINFTMELAVMVVRTKKEIKYYPVVQTIQENHICKVVIAPAKISKKLKENAIEIAIEAVKAVGGFGLFGIELFLSEEGNLLINEMAPRPHNSGHYTIDACVTSQFENHIRSVLDLPLGSTEMLKPYAVMINILGKQNGGGAIADYKSILADENVKLHLYGKAQSRKGRKMGHFTVLGNNLDSLYKQAKTIENKL